jgi:hypothetical protein
VKKNLTWTGKQLKEKIPSLEVIGFRAIQRACKKKPLPTQRMKDQRLAFTMEYQDWGIEKWKKRVP